MSLDENRLSGNVCARETPRVAPLACAAPGVKLWWCELRASALQLRHCYSVLCDSERTRAARYGVESLRDRYVIGRAGLRLVLGRSLGVPPVEVPIIHGERGRPRLAQDAVLDFNVSHTGDVALLGTLAGARLGVDV
ncbi:MAG TPA: hypothetical protein VK617_08005, partial [Gemmatimonadaceae bacterium]|nr:hypothetical protein [Gemmatimonadaceae bacterium]